MCLETAKMGLIGVKFDLFKSLLNLWVIGEGFHAYLCPKSKAALFHL